jgi:hypothetical protein
LSIGDKELVVLTNPKRPLDYRRKNLLILSHGQQQILNQTGKKNNTGFRGVVKAGKNRYRAQGYIGRKNIHLGYRRTAEAAYRELFLPFIEGRIASIKPAKQSKVA